MRFSPIAFATITGLSSIGATATAGVISCGIGSGGESIPGEEDSTPGTALTFGEATTAGTGTGATMPPWAGAINFGEAEIAAAAANPASNPAA